MQERVEIVDFVAEEKTVRGCLTSEFALSVYMHSHYTKKGNR